MASARPSGGYQRSAYRREPPRGGAVLAACEECGAAFEAADGGARVCAPCFDRSLEALEAGFLESYAKFGAKGHRTVAEALFRSQALADPDDRKLIGMRIVEEYLGAAQELMALYVALRRRRQVPLIRTFLDFELTAASVGAFRALTLGRAPDELMRDLGLPILSDVQAARGEIPRRDWRQFAAATASVAHGIERVQKLDQGVLLELADGLKSSSALAHKLDWLPERRLNPDQVALVVVNSRRRVVLSHALSIHEPQLEVFVDAIDKITTATRDAIWLYLHMRDVIALEESGVRDG